LNVYIISRCTVLAGFETNIRKERQLKYIAKAKKKVIYKGRRAAARVKKGRNTGTIRVLPS